MSKFTAAELEEHFHGVANGGIAQYLPDYTGVWENMGEAMTPSYGSDTTRWRIKPANKIIDMAHFIESGIDCEFSDRSNFSNIWVGRLTSTSGSDFHAYACNSGDGHTRYAKFCRPRINHKMFHAGGACPLPEGFEVRLYIRNAPPVVVYGLYMDCYSWVHSMTDVDIIGYEILGLADGWAYPWSEE